MKIGLHDAEKEYLRKKSFPNYALMKISAWHKARGDYVEWWNPLYKYDLVYSSKIFDFTPNNIYLPENTIRGGTGYRDLPIDKALLLLLIFSDFKLLWLPVTELTDIMT